MTKVEILDKLNFDIDSIENQAEKLSDELSFSKKDVRYYFYGLFQGVTDEYYLGLNTYIFFEFVDPHKTFILYEEEKLINFKNNHIKKLLFTQVDPRDLISIKNKEIKIKRYKHNLERNIILGSFASFETCINLIFEHLCNEHDFEKYAIEKIKKNEKSFLNKYEFNDIQKNVIIEKFRLESSLYKKYGFLTENKLDKVTRGIDLEFIKFISIYRNCLLHNNGIYNKTKYEKEYFGSNFIFEKGKQYRIESTEETPLSHWKISFEIKAIFTRLITNLNHNELIEYPD